MGRDLTLFERMRIVTDQHRQRELAGLDTDALLQRSIRENITRLFNIRQGHAPAQPDLGIPTPTEIAYDFPHSIETVRQCLMRSIEKYEPRLLKVQLNYVEVSDDRMSMKFQVNARVQADGVDRGTMAFTVSVGAGGDARVGSN